MVNVDHMELVYAYDDDNVDVDVDVDDTYICNAIEIRVHINGDEGGSRRGTEETAMAGGLDAGDGGRYSTVVEEEEE